MNDDELVVHVTPREIYEQIIGVREAVQGLGHADREILRQLSEQENKIRDHESRMRSMERWKYGIPLAGISALAAIVAALH